MAEPLYSRPQSQAFPRYLSHVVEEVEKVLADRQLIYINFVQNTQLNHKMLILDPEYSFLHDSLKRNSPITTSKVTHMIQSKIVQHLHPQTTQQTCSLPVTQRLGLAISNLYLRSTIKPVSDTTPKHEWTVVHTWVTFNMTTKQETWTSREDGTNKSQSVATSSTSRWRVTLWSTSIVSFTCRHGNKPS